ncbi:hypothetical protein N9F67_00990 [bacterium]|nr:hypothetical protein [bacterium]
MGKIIGESFKPYVDKQVEVRQKKLGQSQHDSDFQTWVTNKTPWLRLSSGVDLNSEVLKTRLGIEDSDKFQNELLAQNYVLFGGTIDANNANPIKGGIVDNLQSRILTDSSYGFDSNTDYGFSPMPGITSATIKSENRGSLRTATINLKCHNTNQFDIIESLYLRLKYTILLEWGHTVYYDNENTLVTNPTNDVYKYFLKMKDTELKSLPDTDPSGSNQNQIFKKIEEAREDSGGNYDGFLGWVTNFKWSLLKDGSYDIEINAITIGDVIESLGANISLPSFNATQNKAKEVLEAEAQAIQDKIDKEEAERLKEDQKEKEIQTLLAQQANPWVLIVTNLIGQSQVGNPRFISSIDSGFYPDVDFPNNISSQLPLPLATDWRGNFIPNTPSDPNNFSMAILKEEWQFDVDVRQYRYAIGLSDKTPN